MSLKREEARFAVVAVPAPVEPDVFHGQRPRAALLHRAVLANGRATDNYTLGDATQQSLREIWNGDAYSDFRDALLSDAPPKACASCGLRWSL